MGLPNPSRETKFSGANADREIFIFPVQLTTCRVGNLIRLIHTLAIYRKERSKRPHQSKRPAALKIAKNRKKRFKRPGAP